MRRRVDNLKTSDKACDSPVYDLAKREDEFREEYGKDGLPKEHIDKYADKHSSVNLEKFEAQKENWIDGLTGLRNKEALYGEMPGLLSLAKRNGKNYSVLMLDMDFFKKVNDTYGHLAGDQALKVLADILKNSIRKSDLIYRFGGEEFAVALYDADSHFAQEIAEKIRESVERAGIVVLDEKENQQTLKKTVSIGCAGTDQLREWKKSEQEVNVDYVLEDLIRVADVSLYEAKESGRNKVILYDPEKNKMQL